MTLQWIGARRLQHFQTENGALAKELLGRIARGDAIAAGDLARLAGISKLDALDAARSRGDAGLFVIASNKVVSKILKNNLAPIDATHGGIDVGGTVRHLTGFKSHIVLSAEAKAMVDGLAPICVDAPGGPVPIREFKAHGVDVARVSALPAGASMNVGPNVVKLSAEAGGTLATVKMIALCKSIGVTPNADPDFNGKDPLRDRLVAGLESGQPDEVAGAIVRLSKNALERFDAFLDRDTGLVYVAERTHGFPRSIKRKCNETRGKRLVAQMLAEVKDKKMAKVSTDAIGKSFPIDALELLTKAGVRVSVKEPDQAQETTLLERLTVGPDLAAMLEKVEQRMGYYMGGTGEVMLSRLSHYTDAECATIARHEFAHALDHALGKNGAYLSFEAEWQAIFDKTRRATDAGVGSPAFPTTYAGTNATEHFAEAMAAYLGPHCRIGPDGAEAVFTREDLRRTNPDAYAFIEKVLVEMVPRALTSKRIQSVETRPQNQVLAALLSRPAHSTEQRTLGEWVFLARARTRLGLAEGSVSELKQALTEVYRAHELAMDGDQTHHEIGAALEDFAKQIKSHVKDLGGEP